MSALNVTGKRKIEGFFHVVHMEHVTSSMEGCLSRKINWVPFIGTPQELVLLYQIFKYLRKNLSNRCVQPPDLILLNVMTSPFSFLTH
jgi:hypothetical protein